MDKKRATRISKYMSKHLRHQPAALGLTLAEDGWVDAEVFRGAAAKRGFSFSREEMEEVVRGCKKQRFAFDEKGRIRANQGHSVKVDLGLEPQNPPEVLYHGTNLGALDVILSGGLQKMKRHHVHLSPDVGTADKVGSRRGKSVLLKVASGEMVRQGFVFYCSTNGVWLVDEVPARFLSRLEEG